MKSTNLVFVLKNIDWIYIKSTDPVFFFFFFLEKHRLDLYGKHRSVFCFEKYRSNLYENHRFGFFCFEKHRLDLYEKHGSSFCLEKEHNETFMIDFLTDLKF